MTTPTITPRLSPSGKFINDPPWTVGDGSDGLIVRAQGGDATQTMLLTTPVAINGLAAVPCNLLAGYVYELDLESELTAIDLTSTGQFQPVFRARRRGTSSWSDWAAFDAPVHHFGYLDGLKQNSDSCYRDRVLNYRPDVAYDAIDVGFIGAAENVGATMITTNCRLRVTEHLP